MHNHAQAIVACDFSWCSQPDSVSFYVLVIMELGRRRILHLNVTAHPSAEWTLQQFREALTEDRPYRFLIHDRDSIFSKELDQAVTAMGVRILKTPVRAPKANAFCERLVGTIRRECLDFLIPFGERHLKRLLTHWVAYYNPLGFTPVLAQVFPTRFDHLHRWEIIVITCPAAHVLRSNAVLGGLHHEYWLEKEAA